MKKLLLIIAFLLTAQSASAALPKAPNNLGLVGYWSFNEGTGLKATDFSGQGNTGTLTGGPTWAAGKLGGALRFDGTDDYVSVGAPSSLAVTNAFSISAWVKSSNLSGRRGVVSKVATGSDYIIIETNESTFRVLAGNLSGTSTALSSGAIDTNWHHVVFKYDGTTSSLYVDGTFVTSATVNLSPYGWNTGGGWVLGGNESGFVSYYDGSLDDIRIYNRALGANEITKLYNAGSSKLLGASSEAGSGLVGHWKLDDRTGARATDSSGQGNNGTLTGFALAGATSNWISGRLGGAVSFDGTNDYVDLGDRDLITSNKMTASAWIKTTGTIDQYETVVGKNYNSTAWALQGDSTANKVRFWAGTYTNQAVSDNTLNDGAWHHLVGVYDGTLGSANVKLYVDGIAQSATANYTSNIANTADRESIGAVINSSGNPFYFFPGSIDDVRIYNRALNADQIKTLFISGSSRPTVANATSSTLTAGTSLASGLVGHWTFDGKYLSTTTARDTSGSGNHGTLTNGPIPGRGMLGQGLDFDGTNDYVNTSRALSNFISASVGSVSVWVKPTGSSPVISASYDGQGIIADSNISGQGAGYMGIYRGTISGLDRIWIQNFDGTEDKIGIPYTNDQWIHIVWLHADGILYAYANGSLVSSTASVNTLVMGGILTIGAPFNILGGGGLYFSGSIDDVRVYNRALSATEVKQLYYLGK